jgi:hypothetical protein
LVRKRLEVIGSNATAFESWKVGQARRPGGGTVAAACADPDHFNYPRQRPIFSGKIMATFLALMANIN